MEKSDLSPDVSIKSPQIHETAYIAEGAQVIGDVILKADSSIWYNTVCRADINQIVIGAIAIEQNHFFKSMVGQAFANIQHILNKMLVVNIHRPWKIHHVMHITITYGWQDQTVFRL